MTNTDLKTQIDTDITNKVTSNSITPLNVGDNLKDIVDYIDQQDALPVSGAPDATSVVKDILKLTQDLGGTADAPTTPTAVHKTGNETIGGDKTFNNSVITNVTDTNVGFWSINSGSSNAIQVANQAGGVGIKVFNNSTGRGIVSSGTTSGSDFVFVGQNNTVDTFTVDRLGNVTGVKFIKTSAGATEALMGDGNTTILASNNTWTVTPTSITNITSLTFYTNTYTRIGSIVSGQIVFTFQTSAASTNSFVFNLPITTATAVTNRPTGSGTVVTGTAEYDPVIATLLSTTTATVNFKTTAVGLFSGVLTFQYSLT